MGGLNIDAFNILLDVPVAIESLEQVVVLDNPDGSIVFFLGNKHYLQARVRNGALIQEPSPQKYPIPMNAFIERHAKDGDCVGLVPITDSPEEVLLSSYTVSLRGMEVETKTRKTTYTGYK